MYFKYGYQQRWSPRRHILKSLALALASKVKSLALASRPQVLENWPVLGSRTALFFELLKFCEALENFFGKRFFVEIAWKIFVKTFFFLESTCACVLGPWPRPRAFLSLASSKRVARIWKRGGGYFERVRSVQTTLTRIFIDLESVSDNLSEIWDEMSRKDRKLKVFSAQN